MVVNDLLRLNLFLSASIPAIGTGIRVVSGIALRANLCRLSDLYTTGRAKCAVSELSPAIVTDMIEYIPVA